MRKPVPNQSIAPLKVLSDEAALEAELHCREIVRNFETRSRMNIQQEMRDLDKWQEQDPEFTGLQGILRMANDVIVQNFDLSLMISDITLWRQKKSLFSADEFDHIRTDELATIPKSRKELMRMRIDFFIKVGELIPVFGDTYWALEEIGSLYMALGDFKMALKAFWDEYFKSALELRPGEDLQELRNCLHALIWPSTIEVPALDKAFVAGTDFSLDGWHDRLGHFRRHTPVLICDNHDIQLLTDCLAMHEPREGSAYGFSGVLYGFDIFSTDQGMKVEDLIRHFKEKNSSRGIGREHITRAVRHSVWQRDMGKCVECGSKERLEFDHIIPVAKGGSNTERNLQLLCELCNRKKSDSI